MGGGLCQGKAARQAASDLHILPDEEPDRAMPKLKRRIKAKPATADMSTGEATTAALIAHGLNTVYALPGVHNDHLFDAFHRAGDALRVVHTRHEQGAAYMALGAALATGKPQAYVVVPGPGLLNSGAALLTAYGMNAPVLAMIGQIPHGAIGRGLGQLHEIRDQAGISRGWSIIPRTSTRRPKRRKKSPRRSPRCGKVGAARPRSNAPSTSGASAAPVTPVRAAAGAHAAHRRGPGEGGGQSCSARPSASSSSSAAARWMLRPR